VQVNAHQLLGAIEVLNLVPARSGVRSSEIVKIVAKKKSLQLMLASEIKGCVSVPTADGEDYEVFVDRAKLFSFLNLAKGSKKEATFSLTYTQEAGGVALEIKLGRRRAEYIGIDPVSGYSKVGAVQEEKELSLDAELVALVGLAAKYTTTDFTRPELNGVHLLKKTDMVVSSKIGAINFAGEHKGISVTTPLPEEFSAFLTQATKVLVSRSGCRLVFPSGSLFRSFNDDQFTGKIASIADLLKQFAAEPLAIQCSAEALQRALGRLKSCCGEDSDYPVLLSAAKGETTLTMTVKGETWQFDEVLRNVTLKGAVTFDLPLFHLLPMLEAAASDKDYLVKLHFSKGASAGYAKLDAKGWHLLMCRTKVEEKGK